MQPSHLLGAPLALASNPSARQHPGPEATEGIAAEVCAPVTPLVALLCWLCMCGQTSCWPACTMMYSHGLRAHGRALIGLRMHSLQLCS